MLYARFANNLTTSPERKLGDAPRLTPRSRTSQTLRELPLAAGEASRHFRHFRGFTLIEMLVVVAIIVILLGIGMAVGPGVLSKGEEEKTRVTLINAQSILEEYLRLTSQSVDDVFDELAASPEDWDGGVNLLFEKATNVKRMEPMFNSFVDNTLIENTSDEWVLFDGWENEIFLKWNDGVQGTGDDLPDAGRPYFASPGMDGQWGRVSGTDPQEEQEADNLYSHEVYN